MKRVAILILALAINVIANEEESIQEVVKDFDTDVPTVKGCLSEAGTTMEELEIAKQKWQEIGESEELDEETKESFNTHGRFIACLLEKKNLMKDSKLLLNNILDAYEKHQSNPKISNKEVITECVNTLNENNELTREQRAFGFIICITRIQTESKR